MSEDRKTAVALGLLLISGIVFGIINSVPALEHSGYLEVLPETQGRVLTAVFFQAAMAVSYVFIAVLVYELAKRYSKRLAAACFAFKIIGAGFLFVGIVSLLLLLWLSRAYVSSGLTDPFYYELTGEMIRSGRDYLNHIGMILPWSIGGLIFYYCTLKMKLFPPWLSIWGFGGSVLTLVATILYMLTAIEMAAPVYLLMNTPAALLELVLAFYIMIRGFEAEI